MGRVKPTFRAPSIAVTGRMSQYGNTYIQMPLESSHSQIGRTTTNELSTEVFPASERLGMQGTIGSELIPPGSLPLRFFSILTRVAAKCLCPSQLLCHRSGERRPGRLLLGQDWQSLSSPQNSRGPFSSYSPVRPNLRTPRGCP